MPKRVDIPPFTTPLKNKEWYPVQRSVVKTYEGKLAKPMQQPPSKLYEILSHMEEEDAEVLREIFMPQGELGQGYARAVKVSTDGLTYVLPQTKARSAVAVMTIAIAIADKLNNYINATPRLEHVCPRITAHELIFLDIDNAAEVSIQEALDAELDDENHDVTNILPDEAMSIRNAQAEE